VIDQDGHFVRRYEGDLDLDHPSPVVRFKRLVFVNHRIHGMHEFWGVIRADAIRKTILKGSYPSADRVLVAWYTLLGRIGRCEEYLFLNREHQQRSQLYMKNKDFRRGSRLSRFVGGGPSPPYEWWDSKFKGKIVFPEWKWVWEYLRAVRMTRLPVGQKLGCYAVMAGLYVKFLPRLARDVIIAAEQVFYRLTGLAPQPADPAHRAAAAAPVAAASNGAAERAGSAEHSGSAGKSVA
jgi:hypothetical protein